jgi:hypothetical protein
MAWYLVFWRNRSTATVVPAASASQARSCAQRSQKQGYGTIEAHLARQSSGQSGDFPRHLDSASLQLIQHSMSKIEDPATTARERR